MKKQLSIQAFIVAALLFASCGDSETRREFRSVDGTIVATCTFLGDDSLHATWTFTDGEGKPFVPRCDSVQVLELGSEGHPMTVVFYLNDHRQRHIQFHDKNLQRRSDGFSVDNLRTGTWTSYFPDGTVQSEGNYFAGREEGPYKVFYENGRPYYLGQYHDGKAVGTWEFYDPEGNLAGTKDYDN